MIGTKSKPLYQPWNHEEFLSDLRVRGLTFIQRWMYCFLLHEAFFVSTRPYLPDNDNLLWQLAGCKSKMQWTENMTAVRSMFEPFTDKDGNKLLRQKRVAKDLARIVQDRKQKAEQGRLGRAKQLAQAKPGPDPGQAGATPRLDPGQAGPSNRSKGSKGNEASKQASEPGSASVPVCSEEEQSMARILGTNLYKAFVLIWQELHGRTAVCRLSQYPEESKEWEMFASNHDHEILEKSFRLWASDQAEQGITEKYPISKFLRVADRYMQKVEALKTAGVKEKRDQEAQAAADEEARRMHDEMYPPDRKVEKPVEGGDIDDL